VNEELKFLEYISTRLDSAGNPYMLTGSMAMMFYAVPRMTRDIDLVAGSDEWPDMDKTAGEGCDTWGFIPLGPKSGVRIDGRHSSMEKSSVQAAERRA